MINYLLQKPLQMPRPKKKPQAAENSGSYRPFPSESVQTRVTPGARLVLSPFGGKKAESGARRTRRRSSTAKAICERMCSPRNNGHLCINTAGEISRLTRHVMLAKSIPPGARDTCKHSSESVDWQRGGFAAAAASSARCRLQIGWRNRLTV